MDQTAHQKRHVELHRALDELLADFILSTKAPLGETNLLTLLTWSHKQTVNPDALSHPTLLEEDNESNQATKTHIKPKRQNSDNQRE